MSNGAGNVIDDFYANRDKVKPNKLNTTYPEILVDGNGKLFFYVWENGEVALEVSSLETACEISNVLIEFIKLKKEKE